MKVIDILNKIANGENVHFRTDYEEYYLGYGKTCNWIIDKYWLNKEVEIIEESKKIEELDFSTELDAIKKTETYNVAKYYLHQALKETEITLNQIIDYINKENK